MKTGNRFRIDLRRLTALLCGFSLLLSSPAVAEGLSSPALDQLRTAITLAQTDLSGNNETILILLQQSMEQMEGSDAAKGIVSSVITLLESGVADETSVCALLQSVIDTYGEPVAEASADSQQSGEDPSEAPADTQKSGEDPSEVPAVTQQPGENASDDGTLSAQDEVSGTAETDALPEPELFDIGLPVYEAANLIRDVFSDYMLIAVPLDWGNNASGRSLTSYSSVNGSGAISPDAGTLQISYFQPESTDLSTAMTEYEDNIAGLKMVTFAGSEELITAGCPGRKMDYTMTVGANSYVCETICFGYENTIYAIELKQGQLAKYDYYPFYQEVRGSAAIGNTQDVEAALAEKAAWEDAQQNQQPDNTGTSDDTGTSDGTEASDGTGTSDGTATSDDTSGNEGGSAAEPGTSSSSTEAVVSSELGGVDIGSFKYQLNGNVYEFPTAVSALAPEDLKLNLDLTIPYDFHSDQDMTEGTWTELVNSQCFYYSSSPYMEMAGVTNLTGNAALLSDCVVTALLDTQGSGVDLILPGGVRVGSAEREILTGFPDFSGMPVDGSAAFRGTQLLYACNTREDGCRGYIILRNDAPFYSAVSIICENGIVKEIYLECIGSVRESGAFQLAE